MQCVGSRTDSIATVDQSDSPEPQAIDSPPTAPLGISSGASRWWSAVACEGVFHCESGVWAAPNNPSALIHEYYPQFMQLTLAIQSGTIAPSAVLAKVNSHSTKNRIALALKELGNAVRTTYSLEWTMDESLCRTVHKGTTKIERHHNIAKHLPSILAVSFGQTTLQIKKKLLFTTNL